MRTDLGLVLKHATWGAEKVNEVNYLTKPPPPVDEFYYVEDFYAVNEQTTGFRPNAQGSNKMNWHLGQGNQGRNYGNYNQGLTMFNMKSTNSTTTSTGVIIVTETIKVGPIFHLKIGKFLLGMVEVVWRDLRKSYKR